jgi:Transposase
MARSSDPAKAAQWRRRLERFGSSGVSVARFCRREGVSVASFYQWRKKLAAAADTPPSGQRPSRPCAFKPLSITATTTSRTIAVHLPGGARLEVPTGDHQAVRVVVRELIRSGRAFEEGGGSC